MSIRPITTRIWRSLQAAGLGLLMVVGPAVVGCGDPPLDPQEYGQVTRGLPEIEGADKNYPLPQLGPPETRSKKGFPGPPPSRARGE